MNINNAGAINLNQPASCFSFVPARVEAPSSLAVVLMHQFATVVAPSQNRVAELPSFMPKPAVQDTALPSLVFIASAAVVFEQRKSIQKTAARFLGNIAQGLTLHQLGVLRC